jgi:hypothetical protein
MWILTLEGITSREDFIDSSLSEKNKRVPSFPFQTFFRRDYDFPNV